VVGKEDAFDRLPEQLRDAERERQARVVLAGFDRIDRLARDLELFGELALRPAAAFAQFAHPAFHQL